MRSMSCSDSMNFGGESYLIALELAFWLWWLDNTFLNKKTHRRVNLTLERFKILDWKVQFNWFQVNDHSSHLWGVLYSNQFFNVLEDSCTNYGSSTLNRTLHVLCRVEHIDDHLSILYCFLRLLLEMHLLLLHWCWHHIDLGWLWLVLLNHAIIMLVTSDLWSLALLTRSPVLKRLLKLVRLLLIWYNLLRTSRTSLKLISVV